MLQHAFKYIGVRELDGPADHPEIMRFFETAGHGWVNSEETPWCSAALCQVVSDAGFEHTGSLRARSWLDWGDPVPQGDQRPGDVAVLWRVSRKSVYGHVGLYLSERDGNLCLLGGNQSNEFKVKKYKAWRLLEYRRAPGT